MLEEWIAIGIPDDITEQAMTWIAKLDADDINIEEQEAFQRWLADDPIHLWAFEELSEFWAKMSFTDLSHLSEMIGSDPQQHSLVPPPSVIRYENASMLAIALVVAGLLFSLF